MLIHTAATYAAFFSRPSLPLFIAFQNYVLDSWIRPIVPPCRGYSIYIQRRLTRYAIAEAKYITAVSRFIADIVQKDLQTDVLIIVFYNGIDINRFTPKPTRKVG